MEKEKVLEIEFKQVWDKWAWRITKQEENVFKRGVFKDTDLKVFSCSSPQFNSLNNRLLLRGSNKTLDDDVKLCTNKEKEIIEEKVKAINEKYGIRKRWRANYEGLYCYIDDDGETGWAIDNRTISDNKKYELGNYFQTREQAEKARELQKKAYQEFWKHE